jgi:hypothetical protein
MPTKRRKHRKKGGPTRRVHARGVQPPPKKPRRTRNLEKLRHRAWLELANELAPLIPEAVRAAREEGKTALLRLLTRFFKLPVKSEGTQKMNIIWDLPRPPRERELSDSEKKSNLALERNAEYRTRQITDAVSKKPEGPQQ